VSGRAICPRLWKQIILQINGRVCISRPCCVDENNHIFNEIEAGHERSFAAYMLMKVIRP